MLGWPICDRGWKDGGTQVCPQATDSVAPHDRQHGHPKPRPGVQPSRAHLRPCLRRPGLRSGWSCACFSGAAGLRCLAAPRVSTDDVSMTVSDRRPLSSPNTLLQQPIASLGLPLPQLSANGECAAPRFAHTEFRLGSVHVLQAAGVEPELNNRRDGAGPDGRGLGERQGCMDPEYKVLRDPKKCYLELATKFSFQTNETICQRQPRRYTVAMSAGTGPQRLVA